MAEIDPAGTFSFWPNAAGGATGIAISVVCPECGVAAGFFGFVASRLFGLFGHHRSAFHGILKPRPSAIPWNDTFGVPSGGLTSGPNYWTGNAGGSVNYTLPFGFSGTVFAGFICDTLHHCGFYWGRGVGAAVGAGASGGVQVGFSNGNTICAFGGPFNNYSGTFGAEAAGTVDYYRGNGDAPGGTVSGSGITLGVGGGAGASIYHTWTHIIPLGGHSCISGKLR